MSSTVRAKDLVAVVSQLKAEIRRGVVVPASKIVQDPTHRFVSDSDLVMINATAGLDGGIVDDTYGGLPEVPSDSPVIDVGGVL